MRRRGFPAKTVDWYENYLCSRTASLEIKGTEVTKQLTKGTPQGGILSPLCWNIALDRCLDELNEDTGIRAVGYADDVCILHDGPDASTLVDRLQPKVDHIVEWGRRAGITFNSSKTEMVMFTMKTTPKKGYKRIKIDGKPVEYSDSVKYLGVTLDRRLNWNTHISLKTEKCKKHLNILKALIRTKVGPNPKIMKWAYEGIVRPSLLYACHLWAWKLDAWGSATLKQKLKRINRLGCMSVAPIWKSAPTDGLEIAYNILPLDLQVLKTAISTHCRIRHSYGRENWDGIADQKSKRSHILFLEKQAAKIDLDDDHRDKMAQIKIWNKNYEVLDFKSNSDMAFEHPNHWYCYTDGSKLDGNSGSGFVIRQNYENMYQGSLYLGTKTTVYQAEVIAVALAAGEILDLRDQRITFRIDNQAMLHSLNSHVCDQKSVWDSIRFLNKLGESNTVQLQWIKAHVGHLGNEVADAMAKEGTLAAGTSALPLSPGLVPDAHIKSSIKAHIIALWKRRWQKTCSPGPDQECRQTALWFPEPSDKLSKSLGKYNRKQLGRMVEFVTGHCNLNYQISHTDESHSQICRLCQEDDSIESPEHLILECPVTLFHRMQVNLAPETKDINPKWTPGQLWDFICNPMILDLLEERQLID